MNTTLSIRELTRSSKILLEYDYINIEDKKVHQYKGVFVPAKYADEVKDYIETKLLHEKEAKRKALLKFAGMAAGEIGSKSYKQIKSEKLKSRNE